MVSLLNIQVHLPEKYSKTPLFILTNLNCRFLEIRAYQCYGPQRKIMVSTEPLAHFAGTLAKSFGKLLFRQSLRLRSQLSRFRLCFCFANPSAFAHGCCASAYAFALPIPPPSLAVFRSKPIRSFFAGKLSFSTRDWHGDSTDCSKQLFRSTTLFKIGECAR